MQSLSSTTKSQWQTYKQLELIPDSVPNPHPNVSAFTLGINLAWKKLLSLLVDELVDVEQQVDYIERCWALNEFGQGDNPSSPLQRLWTLMN